MERLANRERFNFRPIDLVHVADTSERVEIFEIFDVDPDDLRERKLKIMDVYLNAIELFRSRRWRAAAEGFQECATVLPQDRAVRLHLDRSRYYQANQPGDEWDGVNFTGKRR